MKTQANHEPAGENEPDREQLIQKRAYELYLKRGSKPGHELEDWVQAEREIRAAEQRHEHQMV